MLSIMWLTSTILEALITDHLRDLLQLWRSISQCKISQCRKIETRRTAFFYDLIPWIEINAKFWSQKLAQSTYHQCPEFAITAHFKLLIPPHLSTQNMDMCHGTIGFNLIEIESQPNWSYIDSWWGYGWEYVVQLELLAHGSDQINHGVNI